MTIKNILSWQILAITATVIGVVTCILFNVFPSHKLLYSLLLLISFISFIFSLYQLKKEADVNENVSVEIAKELFWQASHDRETGYLNLRATHREIQKYTGSKNAQNQQHGLIRLDIDNFLTVKKTFGNDAVLSIKNLVASIIESYIQSPSIMSIAGERGFAIFCPNFKTEDIKKLIDNLLTAARQKEFIWHEKELPISISIGWTIVVGNSEFSSALINQAEIACIKASQKGGNIAERYRVPDLTYVNEIEIVSKISRALKENNFSLYHQRIYALSHAATKKSPTATPMMTEVLIRLEDNDSAITPNSFLPIAEKFSLMVDIDKWVILNTFTFMNKNKNIPQVINCVYSINLSGASLNDESLLGFISDNLEKFQINPEQICFEITESIAIKNLHHAAYLVGYLNRLGCLIALDDFGTGVSSLEYLKLLPIDKLKLDGAFVKNLHNNEVDFEIIKAISNICQTLNIEVIAEFVEKPETLVKLHELGVDYAQGYLLHRPEILKKDTLNDSHQSKHSSIQVFLADPKTSH